MNLEEKIEGGAAVQAAPGGLAAAHPHEVTVTARVLPAGTPVKFKVAETASLLQLMKDGARQLGVELLPPAPQRPLDRLHNLGKHDEAGPAIEDLQQPVGEYLKEKGTTKDFGIELVLAFRVNTRWAVAPQPQMTPREILALPAINLDYSQYTLYPPGSATALPLDTPVTITRGMAFEAQRDGKYGGAPNMSSPAAEDEVDLLVGRGEAVELIEAGGQSYVLGRALAAPTPPWDQGTYDILVAIPAAYDAAALDAFYLSMPYKFHGGTHPRVQGAVITVHGRQWQLVSWHYQDGKPWTRGLDDLASHLTHCQGFFFNRGAVNAYN